MGKHINRIGEIHITKTSGRAKIIEWFGCKNCTIQFDDGVELTEVNYFALKKGQPHNPNNRTIYGVGYEGAGKYNSKNSPIASSRWKGMITRVYYNSYKIRQPTYEDCSVAEEWLNFQNFAEWFEENWKPWMDSEWQLDKDILSLGNKVYSPKTCCFVPRDINIMITGDGKRIHLYEKYNKFYAVLSVKRKRIKLNPTDSREKAVEIFLVAKKRHMKKVLSKYKDYLDRKVIDKLEYIIENYTKS